MEISILKTILWQQFGAAIDMLKNAITACPEKLWDNNSKFWYTSYHTLLFLDYYLCETPDNFTPPAPFTMSEFEGTMPERNYTQQELLTYLSFCQQRCHDKIADLTEENATERWINSKRDYSMIEILLYNMRHVQHHTAQLNLVLRQNEIPAPDWVSRTAASL